FRYSEGRSERASEIATEFVRLGVDVIVAHFTPAVRAAMGVTQTIPIVMGAGQRSVTIRLHRQLGSPLRQRSGAIGNGSRDWRQTRAPPTGSLSEPGPGRRSRVDPGHRPV